MRMDVDLTYLKYFYSVATEGGFTSASKTLGVQQPSVTRGVKNLEEQLGVILFERSGKKVSLTVSGREVFESCERIFNEAQKIRQIAEAETKVCSGPFRFGVSSPVSTHLVPELLSGYLRQFPETWPMMYSGTGEDLLQKIRNAELEFGLFLHLPEMLPGLVKKNLVKYRFHLVVGNRWKNDGKVKARFIGSREVEDIHTKRFPALERLKRDVPEARLAISANDISSHKEMLLRGLGVSILPEFMISDEIKKGTLVDLYPREEFIFPLVLITRKDGVLSRPAAEFLKVFHDL